ncbi:hypothetical protein Droror1_Dr00004160 [Drosera rotundifolia]
MHSQTQKSCFTTPKSPTAQSEEEEFFQQGMVSILDSEEKTHPFLPPHRRTLSADMSSRQWQLSAEEVPERNTTSLHIWNSIQAENKKAEELQKPQLDLWSSIISSAGTSITLPPPYVHPMAKRSASSLCEKSLEICTESLGSETGSDGFSSYLPSEPENSDSDEDDDGKPVELECWRAFNDSDEVRVSSVNVKYNYSTCRALLSPVKSFPPPLPSLADRGNGSNLQMRSRRQDGRLVVEAVTVPSQNCFRAQRHDGRLLLTLTNTQTIDEEETRDETAENPTPKMGDLQETRDETAENPTPKMGDLQAIKKERTEKKEVKITIMDDNPKLPARMGMTMNVTKLIGLTKTTPWPHRFNKVVTTIEATAVADEGEEKSARLIPATQSSTTATLNAYECYWRTKPTPVAVLKPLTSKAQPLKTTQGSAGGATEQQELVVVKGKEAEYLVPLLRGCKEQGRRSLLLWEPYCIATT